MNNIVLVAVSQRTENLLHNSSAVTLSESFALKDFIKKLTTLAILSDYHEALAVVEDFEHFKDVRVVHGL